MDPAILPVLLVLAVLFVLFWFVQSFVGRSKQKTSDQSMVMLQNQVNEMTRQNAEQIDRLRQSLEKLNDGMQKTLTDSNRNVGERLDGAAKVIKDVSQQLGQLQESTKNVHEIGKDIASLQEVLRSPKLRGNLSELFLDDLLSQILPPEHYRMQYTFSGGETVDAVIVLKAGMVPVDAKFPLENFKRVIETEDEGERKAARKAFAKDVKIHIDAISSKYIRTDEGTFDFALMYIPAENVYYETIVKDTDVTSTSLFNYALQKRVIPVSPNSFYAYLQTILLGLKGMRVEESAREIINHLSRLQKEFEKFQEAFRLVGQHLDNSVKKFSEAEKRLGKVEGKMEQIEGSIEGEEPPSALPEA
ncbi:MAG: DNA recombination protein RmuC [Verrucomicrobia bacterium]|nr:DNA recombination protein RmuC [Verrucomicrobiota bacterium]